VVEARSRIITQPRSAGAPDHRLSNDHD